MWCSELSRVVMIPQKFELTTAQTDSVYLQIFAKYELVLNYSSNLHGKYNVKNDCLNYLEKWLLRCHFCSYFPYRVKDFPEK